MSATVLKLRRAALRGFVAVAWAVPALAQAPPEARALRFDARLLPAGAVLGATAAVAVAPILLAGHLPHTTCAPCDPASLPPIDRGTVGAVRPGWGTLSNVTEIAVLGGAGLLLAREAHGDWGVAREDLTVFAQAIGTATLVDNWIKVLVARPRPARYLPSAAGTSTSAATGLSFPSGHTTGAMAAAFAYWSIQSRRGMAGARSRGVVALISAAAVVGVLRVVAREHFPTDVMAGALLGAVVGWEVPQHYPVQRSPSPP
ncbi:MAG: phosphatase PAP2 family protein [Gemmatimonadales bacterium]